MRDIGQELNISTGSIYHHFKSKDAIIDRVAEEGALGVNKAREYYCSLGSISPTETLRKCIVWLLEYGHRNRNNILFLNREYRLFSPLRAAALSESSRQYVSFFEHLLDEGVRMGEFRIDNPRVVAFNIWSSQQEIAMHGWIMRESMPIEQFIDQQASFIINSISIRHHREQVPSLRGPGDAEGR